MELFFTKSFIRDHQDLPESLRQTVDKKLRLFLANPRHPSLHIKKMHDPREIWEGRITAGYRFTFQTDGDRIMLRRLGTHDILKKP